MRTLQEWLNAYGVSHQNPINKAFHWVCIPIIFITIIGLFASIPSQFLRDFFPENIQPFIHWGTVAIILALLFYIRLSFTMFVAVAVWCVFCLWLITQLQALPLPLWATSLILFALAWVGQFYGHYKEGAKPSFFQDLQFLLIGPAWLIAFILTKMRIKY